MRLYSLLNSFPVTSRWVNKKIIERRDDILRKIHPYLTKNSHILDVGSGTGHTAHQLIKDGYEVTCVDLVSQNVFSDTKPVLYDGKKLPFEDKKFDTALLITVLHHTPDPVLVLKETARVSRDMIIMEDTYNSFLQKIATFWMDSIGNLEFAGHPHTNKTDVEWERLFNKLGYEILAKEKEKFFLIFESTTYHLGIKKTER